MASKARARSFVDIGVLALAYVLVARLGLMLDAVSGFATLVWPPTGLALTIVLLLGGRFAGGVFLGAFAVNVWSGAPPLVAGAIAVGNTLEALLGAWALRRLTGFQGSFDRLRHVVGLIVPAAMVSTLVSATIGVGSLSLGGLIKPNGFWETWRAWWVGDMLGDLVIAALLLAWATPRTTKITLGRALEAALLGITVVAASLAVFCLKPGVAAYPFQSPYVVFPLFVWSALRFELRGATTVTALATMIAVWGTARGSGPFAQESLAESLLALQTFMGSAAFTPLVVAGAMSDRARATREREKVVATVSHELRSPLNAIQMSSDLLEREAERGVDTARVRKHTAVVQRSVERMTRLIGDLLDAAAIDAGRLSVKRAEHDSRALVGEAVDALQPLAASKKLTVRAEAGEPLAILCDRQRVIQVLANLIGNAIKFTAEGGTITVRTRRAQHQACIMVEDNGVGIETSALRHVFDRYWRAPPSAGGGTGLGLFIAKGIIEAHEGKIWVDSRPHAGTTFYFTLPLSE